MIEVDDGVKSNIVDITERDVGNETRRVTK
jgi:hypothetical protein